MKKASTKEDILEAALTLFSRFGYDGTSISHIAKEAKLTKGGVYHHFRSKDDLFHQLHEYTMSKELLPMIENAQKIHSAQDRVAYCIQEITKIMAEGRAARVLLQEVGRIKAKKRARIKQVYRTAYELVREGIIELKREGRARDVNPTFSSFAAFGMCFWLLYWFDHTRNGKDKTSEELGRLFSDIFFKGILK